MPEITTVCPCGTVFTHMSSRAKKYCSDRCKWDRRPRVSCTRCGGPTGYPVSKSPVSPVCNSCRPSVTAEYIKNLGGPSRAYRQTRDAECGMCGESFVSVWRSGRGWSKFCSRPCGARWSHVAAGGWGGAGRDPERYRTTDEKARRKRRAVLAGVEREPYTLAAIAQRDSFRCHLCGGHVDMSIRWPDLRSASVDHVVPISLGGDDTRANVRLAHLGENVARGNRSVSEWVSLRAPGLAIV